MRLSSIPIPRLVAITGGVYFAAILVLVVTQTPIGTPLFFATFAAGAAAYAVMVARVWNAPDVRGGAMLAALLLAVLFRIPPAVAPVGSDSDMVRYLWDGRVQQLGYNPYEVLPADPALAHTHNAETANMPSRRHRTPYPPGAQLFFRLIVAIVNSRLGMKLALVACDLLTVAILWKWLERTGRNRWLTLAYAWHPLVIFEVAHSGHIDALGAVWLAAAAYWLSCRRTALASCAFVLAVATKLLPIVLAPLFFRRVRARDVVLAGAMGLVLSLPYASDGRLPLGSVPNVVEHFRFNGPAFRAAAWISSPQGAAGVAVLLGLACAIWARWRLAAEDPAAWAWPMAVALLGAPVIYPWYLLYLTPFLFTAATLPLTVWSLSVVPVYLVWHLARLGGRWAVPPPILWLEYGALAAACAILLAQWAAQRRRSTRLPAASQPS